MAKPKTELPAPLARTGGGAILQRTANRRVMIGGGAAVLASSFLGANFIAGFVMPRSRAEEGARPVSSVEIEVPITSAPPAQAAGFVDEEALPGEIHPPAGPAAETPAAAEPTKPPSAPATVAGEPGWSRNARPFIDTAGRPALAIVIDDLGVDLRRTQRAMLLPGPVTLAFMTYGSALDRQTSEATGRGHELLVHVPMQPVGPADPGANALLEGLSEDEVRRRLTWGLDRFSGYVGINNHMGSRFSADAKGMAVVMAELERRRVMFLDSRTTPASKGVITARQANVPAIERNVFLDNVDERGAVLRQLDASEQVARKHGLAVAIGHPRDATLAALESWIPDALARGLEIVPITTALRRSRAV